QVGLFPPQDTSNHVTAAKEPPHARAPHAGWMTCSGRSPGSRVITLLRLPGLCLKSSVAYWRRTRRLQLRAQPRIWLVVRTMTNLTEFSFADCKTSKPEPFYLKRCRNLCQTRA